jgi:lysyl-tRNA synthetase class 2
MKIENIKIRSKILQIIRNFFITRGFYEVDTPINISAPANEIFIDAPQLADKTFLRTSPELQMKQLLSKGMDKIFQIGSCFREGERGTRHNPEFTMLEWYRTNSDYMDILADTKELIREIAIELCGTAIIEYDGNTIDLNNWVTIPVDAAFEKLAHWTPSLNYDQDRFDLDLVNKIEPELPMTKPVILKDYPLEAAALSKQSESNPLVAERWELYIGGMELANAYSELVDANEQRERFTKTAEKRKNMGAVAYPIDEDFLSAMDNLPECGGIALGIDRLIMLFSNSQNILDCRF